METQADPIHIVLGSDERYAQHLAVAVASILYNTKASVVFHVLHDDLRDETLANLSACGVRGPAQFDFIPLEAQEPGCWLESANPYGNAVEIAIARWGTCRSRPATRLRLP